MAAIFFESSAAVVSGVLLGERYRVIAGGARTERRWKRAALVLLRIHEQRVAGVERGEVIKVTSLLYVVVSIRT